LRVSALQVSSKKVEAANERVDGGVSGGGGSGGSRGCGGGRRACVYARTNTVRLDQQCVHSIQTYAVKAPLRGVGDTHGDNEVR
jgi:hypothetical protein